jgi:hypothetical protein
MIKYILSIFLLLFYLKGSSQNLLDRISFKVGFSNSTQVWGYTPFDHIRPPEKSIQSVFFNLQYEQPITKKSYITIGLQTLEKGYRTTYTSDPDPVFQYTQTYEYRLSYIELPINYVYHWKKYSFIGGTIISYMWQDAYRFKEIDVLNRNNKTTTYYSNYATPYTAPDRFIRWDFGVNIGIARKIYKNFDIELTMQEHYVDFDKWKSRDLVFNECFLLGVRYTFLSYK